MVTLAKLDERKRWHVFIGGFQESLCGRVVAWDCEERVELEGPDEAGRVSGQICRPCLKRLVRIAETAEALNGRIP